MEYKLLIDGQWVAGGAALEVKNKYNGQTVGVLPTARREDLDAALNAAKRAEEVMAEMPAYERAEILLRTATLIRERADDLAKTVAKVTLELGNASPVVVAPDADLDFVAKRCAVGAFYNSGQVCVSVQRIYSQKQVYEPFTEKFVAASNALVVGDPLDERVDVGPMIDSKEVERIEGWVKEATAGERTF
jgi:acyl-CoA reductase-like NAD-dependent aldehyde dehydrogenase